MTLAEMPAWAQGAIALLLVTGALLTLVGAFGLVRLEDFFQRVHAPALGNTLGTWCIVAASILTFSLLEGRLVLHAVLIGCFIVITAPVTIVLLVRAAIARERRAGRAREVPTGLTDPSARAPAPEDPGLPGR